MTSLREKWEMRDRALEDLDRTINEMQKEFAGTNGGLDMTHQDFARLRKSLSDAYGRVLTTGGGKSVDKKKAEILLHLLALAEKKAPRTEESGPHQEEQGQEAQGQ